jgi:hypothetical protein
MEELTLYKASKNIEMEMQSDMERNQLRAL